MFFAVVYSCEDSEQKEPKRQITRTKEIKRTNRNFDLLMTRF